VPTIAPGGSGGSGGSSGSGGSISAGDSLAAIVRDESLRALGKPA
jgi:hypothetical protein